MLHGTHGPRTEALTSCVPRRCPSWPTRPHRPPHARALRCRGVGNSSLGSSNADEIAFDEEDIMGGAGGGFGGLGEEVVEMAEGEDEGGSPTTGATDALSGHLLYCKVRMRVNPDCTRTPLLLPLRMLPSCRLLS